MGKKELENEREKHFKREDAFFSLIIINFIVMLAVAYLIRDITWIKRYPSLVGVPFVSTEAIFGFLLLRSAYMTIVIRSYVSELPVEKKVCRNVDDQILLAGIKNTIESKCSCGKKISLDQKYCYECWVSIYEPWPHF
jgi:hypothetical protein